MTLYTVLAWDEREQRDKVFERVHAESAQAAIDDVKVRYNGSVADWDKDALTPELSAVPAPTVAARIDLGADEASRIADAAPQDAKRLLRASMRVVQ